MRVISSVPAMQKLALQWKRSGVRVGFVPTMGYLHEGHLSLVAEARKRVGAKGLVVLSIYVNPAQFAPTEDLSRYPRDFARDSRLCRQAGVNVIFAPTDGEMYPPAGPGGFSTYVQEEILSRVMEGTSRPTHFRGVTTVVAKLFNLVLPDVAVFGAKDFQQAAILRRMVRDLNFPVRMVVAPTVREPDGLAMSSRNKYLVGDLRPQALVLHHTITAVRDRVRKARRPVPAGALRKVVRNLVDQVPEARLDYVEFFDPETLLALPRVLPGARMALAVFVGNTRLIDNALL